jgi:Uma2 family endonuclease
LDAEKLPAVLACVEKWELENFNPEPFPASPRGASHKLIDFIFSELVTIYMGEKEVPNE